MSLDAGSASGSLTIDTSEWTAGFDAAIAAAQTASTQIPESLKTIQEEVATLGTELENNAKVSEFFGDTLGGLRAQQDLLKESITSLIRQGVDPQSEALQTLKQQYDETTTELKKMGDGTDSFTDKITSLLETVGAAAAFDSLLSGVMDSVAAFSEAEKVADRLRVSLEMRGLEDSYDTLYALSAEMQTLTGVSDEVISQMSAEMIAQGKSVAQVQEVISATAAYATATGQEMNAAYMQLNATLSGSAGRLSRMIPALNDFTEEELKNGAAIEYINNSYGAFTGQVGETEIAMNLMNETVGDASEALGETFKPIVLAVTGGVTALAKIFIALPGPMKSVFGIITTAGLAAFGALMVRAVALTAAKWGLFGANMAVNAAMAVGNPLLWVGIAAAGAAVIATGLVIAAKVREARAIEDTTEAEHGRTSAAMSSIEAMNAQRAALEEYGASLSNTSDQELEATRIQLFAYEQRAQGAMREYYAARRIIVEREQSARRAAAAEEIRRQRAEEAARAYAAEMRVATQAIEAAKTEEEKLLEQIAQLEALKTNSAQDESTRLQAIQVLQEKLVDVRERQNSAGVDAVELAGELADVTTAATETALAGTEEQLSYWEQLKNSAREYFDVVGNVGEASFEELVTTMLDATKYFTSAASKLSGQYWDNEKARYTNEYNAAIASLSARLEQQKITQEEYDAERDRLDQEKLSRDNENAKKSFETQKALDIAGVWMDAASSIMGWWKAAPMLGPIAGPVFGGVMTTATLGYATAYSGMIAAEEFVPAYSMGGTAGGLSRINEAGGEIVNLPDGTMVIPNDISSKIARASSGTTINISFDGARIDEDVDLARLAKEVSQQIAREMRGVTR